MNMSLYSGRLLSTTVLFIASFLWSLPSSVPANNFPIRLLVETMDELGQPVQDAQVTVQIRYWNEETQFRAISETRGTTDSSGRAFFEEDTYGHVDARATHPNHYASRWSLRFRNPRLRLPLRLRTKRNPGPMIFHREIVRPFPAEQQMLGLDLVRMDWLPPHGNGGHADVRLVVASRHVNEERYQAVMQMRFPGPGNGILPIDLDPADRRSEFQSDYEAPETGYRRDAVFHRTEGMREPENPEEGEAFYFRIRSETNAEGEVTAHYGRFYGPMVVMSHSTPLLAINEIFINPRRNSRNMEHDPERPVRELLVRN